MGFQSETFENAPKILTTKIYIYVVNLAAFLKPQNAHAHEYNFSLTILIEHQVREQKMAVVEAKRIQKAPKVIYEQTPTFVQSAAF